MANHLTPEELSKEVGMDRDDVIRLCVEEGVPIYHGKIDKTLFQAQLKASASLKRAGRSPQRLRASPRAARAARAFPGRLVGAGTCLAPTGGV